MSTTWFDDGAEVLRKLYQRQGEDIYPCPCCLEEHTRSQIGELSVDHVPPQSMGGHALVLVCKTCNSHSGAHFDTHAAKRLIVRNLIAGNDPGRAVDAEFDANGEMIRGTIAYSGGRMILQGVRKRNSPSQIDRHREELDAMWQRGSAPTFSFRLAAREGFCPRAADISMARAAYLAGFAALGWSYALREILDPIRDQLSKPDENIIPALSVAEPRAPSDRRLMMLVRSPEELRSLLVVMGHECIFLPGFTNPQSVHDISQSLSQWRAAGEVTADLSGLTIPWPENPTYFLDRKIINLLRAVGELASDSGPML